MAMREERFRQAAWTYFFYGLVYLIGAGYLASQGIGVRGMRVGPEVRWFVFGTVLLIVIPWLLSREVSWFDRWILSRRDFTRILTLFVAYRAFEVGRVALAPKVPSVPVPGGGEVPMALGAWVFFAITMVAAAMLARAAWSRRE